MTSCGEACALVAAEGVTASAAVGLAPVFGFGQAERRPEQAERRRGGQEEAAFHRTVLPSAAIFAAWVSIREGPVVPRMASARLASSAEPCTMTRKSSALRSVW